MAQRPDHDCLFQLASSQAGYFTAWQARGCGLDRRLLSYHVKAGNHVRVHHGVYRLARYPSSAHEQVMVAWLSTGPDKAVVSHESALQIHGLSDVVPRAVHLTVRRGTRGGRQPRLVTVKIHTTTKRFEPQEVQEREGMRVSAPPRAIMDTAGSGVAPDQVVLAVREALDRGLASRGELLEAVLGRSARVQELVRRGVQEALVQRRARSGHSAGMHVNESDKRRQHGTRRRPGPPRDSRAIQPMTSVEEILKARRAEILRIASRHGARNVRVFGSAARGEASDRSDVDFLIDLEPGRSLLDHAALFLELQNLLGRPVDVVTERGLRPRIRDRILREAVAL